MTPLSFQPQQAPVQQLLTGGLTELGDRRVPTGIRKHPVAQAELTLTGFNGDTQGDRKNHGGSEKAVHQYCLDHYPFWRDAIGPVEPLAQPGAFGENLVVSGLKENDVCLGDTWAVGDALLQVSQARRPCWRLNQRFGVRDMARRVTETGRTGWYYRVLKPGTVTAGDTLELRERPHAEWPLSRLFRVLLQDSPHPPTLEAVADLTLLSNSWRDLARQRAASGKG